jgi:hypothetical protein
MMLHTTRYSWHESLLKRAVEVLVGDHEPEAAIPEESGKELANTGCQGNWSEVAWVGGIL